jgi:predicted MFS family arabinose efflux permease
VAQAVSRPAIGLREYALLVGVGAFVTTFAQSRVLALYPTTFLLKEQFHLPKEGVAFFYFWVTFPWNVKPLVGILTDAFPLFGTRRRHYMMLGSVAAVVLWVVMGASSGIYLWLLYATLGMNIATVFASTVMGGLMVEAGQAFGAPGRMASLRQVAQNVAAILAPLLGGYLAARAYGWTTAIGAATSLGLAASTFVLLREPRVEAAQHTKSQAIDRTAERPPLVMILGLIGMAAIATALLAMADLRNVAYSLYGLVAAFAIIMVTSILPTTNPVVVRAQHQLGQIFRSTTLWMAVFLLFLVYTVPGYNTALVYQQSDVLKFGKSFIGVLASLEGVFGVIAAVLYAFFCRKLNLRMLMVGAVGLNGIVTLLYLAYAAPTAPFIHSLSGFAVIMSELALMDLAVRSTPRGCEALGFALMMSVRNFGLGISDVIGTQLMDQYHIRFATLIMVNALFTLAVLIFVPLLPRAVLNRREGEAFV